MLTDRQGNTVKGANVEAVDLYDRAVEAFNVFRGDPVALIDGAIGAAPECAMAHIAKVHFLALATEPAATAMARPILEQAKSMRLDDREASHLAALEHVLAGEWTAAALAMDRHNIAYPRDMIALQSGHLMDFFRANARNLRDRIGRALPRWSPDTPGYSILHGMHAFGLEECGDYARAEEAGRHAVELEPLDCWAHHAVAHVMDMQGRAEDGIGWMMAREPHWTGESNFFKVHNWWHRALYHLDLLQIEQVLALYDGPIRGDCSGVAVDMVDASALLWRLHVSGQDVGDRWTELAACWDAHADGRSYPFNDWHAAMAYLGAERESDVDRIVQALRANPGNGSEVDDWGRRTGLPLVEGFAAFWHGDYETAIDRLHGARFIANSFGGSHAQRDVIDWTLTEAAVRARRPGMAQALANERLALKPHSPVNRQFLSRAGDAARSRQNTA